jgi:transcriptional regulator with XRE-family HTH domain
MSTENTEHVTLGAVAARLKMSESSVSRLRSGRRSPSWETMRKIQTEYAWPIDEQTALLASGENGRARYSRQFRERLFGASESE